MSTERERYIDGLRILATVLENHPEVPLPSNGSITPLLLTFWDNGTARHQMAAAARAIPCSWAKNVTDGYLRLNGSIAGLKLQLTALRDAVCTRRVVGTEEREVEEVVKPAVTRKVVKPIEVVEWDCSPILRAAPEPAVEERGVSDANLGDLALEREPS